MKNRILSADILKSISIIGVVFIHGASLLGCDSDFLLHTSEIFRFGVPCFIIMWAYFFEKSLVQKNKKARYMYIKQRFMHHFIVFLIWSIIYFFLGVDWKNVTLTKILTTHFSGFGWAGQYFFIVLFQLTLLFSFLRYCYSNKIVRYIVLTCSIILYIMYGYHYSVFPEIIHKLGIRPFILWIVYVFAGIALAKNEIPKIPKIFALLVFFIPIEFYVLDYFHLEHTPYTMPSVLIGSIVLCTIMLQSTYIHIKKITLTLIAKIGESTMTIFITNSLIIIVLNKLLSEYVCLNCTILGKITVPFVSTSIIVFIGVGIDGLIKKVKLKGILN
ncbi:MAG: acyltransferase [Bacteroidales bacterium]|jgi:fucose 4-O-acetylase-like acetyltransferase|nr:acyltransferase [Bacteroidales bacterium]